MRNTKRIVLAASVSALLGATAWAQVPHYGGDTYGDTERGDSRMEQQRDTSSQMEQRRDTSSRDSATHHRGVTASDQKNDGPDVKITRDIRKEIMSRDGMSVNAQNVTIVTTDGKVTLRGVVNTASEKRIIGQMATKAAGNKNVTNDLQVK